MPISADEIETLVSTLLAGSVGVAIAYMALRNLRPIGDPSWLLFQRKHPFILFFIVYVLGFFGLAIAKDLHEVLVSGPQHVHSIAYPYLFALVWAIPISIAQLLYSARHGDSHA